MIDLCVGPHIPHTGKIKAFMVTKVFTTPYLGATPGTDSVIHIELSILFPW